MIVTCPECGAKISKEADPCPRCGLIKAGGRSKEWNEQCLPHHKNGSIKYDRPRECLKCGYVDIYWELKGAGLTRDGVGYGVSIGDIYCPKCGATADSGRWADEKPTESPETKKWKPVGCIIFFVCIIIFIVLFFFLKYAQR